VVGTSARIRKLPGTIFGQEIDYPAEVFRDFPQSLKANAGIIHKYPPTASFDIVSKTNLPAIRRCINYVVEKSWLNKLTRNSF
jgi:hypothetical protein